MIESKFNWWAILPLVLSVIIFAVISYLTYFIFLMPKDGSMTPALYFMLPLVLVFCLWTFIWVFAERKKRALCVELFSHSIIVSGFYGYGKKHLYAFTGFTGYTLSQLPNYYGDTSEYLHIIKGTKKVISISAFYHKNYQELKDGLTGSLEFLGEIPFDIKNEWKDIFN